MRYNSIDSTIANMTAEDIKARWARMEFTVLTRSEGDDKTWHEIEIQRIRDGLVTEVYGLPALPQHLILEGFYTKTDIFKAFGGGRAFTVTQVKGLENPELPFRPPID